MRRRLPPLNSLRAFESAARQLSFTKAADELAVTQSAVSHQVAALEEWAGVPLFKRQGRAMVLTEAAARFLPAHARREDEVNQQHEFAAEHQTTEGLPPDALVAE